MMGAARVGDLESAGALPPFQNEEPAELVAVLSAIARAVVDIGTALREGSAEFAASEVGTANAFGDAQLSVDVASDKVVFDRLKGLCSVASSEETTREVPMEGSSSYSVAFDPLDGSSIVDANFTVGSIFGVWPTPSLLNVTPRQQHAAVMAMYGPRITMAVATANNGCFELTWAKQQWVRTKRFCISAAGKVFAPGNLRATKDCKEYENLVQEWIKEKYTLRYTGGMVPDVYHILFKGKGVFTNCSSPGAKAKLRLLYECGPIAFIVERAGGVSLVDPAFSGGAAQSVLDVAVKDLDQRIGVCYGGKDEVEVFKKHMLPAMGTSIEVSGEA